MLWYFFTVSILKPLLFYMTLKQYNYFKISQNQAKGTSFFIFNFPKLFKFNRTRNTDTYICCFETHGTRKTVLLIVKKNQTIAIFQSSLHHLHKNFESFSNMLRDLFSDMYIRKKICYGTSGFIQIAIIRYAVILCS